jgi:hypothetical protein
MSSSSANKNIVVVNVEVTNFKQYSKKFLMEAWYRMQENVENNPNMHIQSSTIIFFTME